MGEKKKASDEKVLFATFSISQKYPSQQYNSILNINIRVGTW